MRRRPPIYLQTAASGLVTWFRYANKWCNSPFASHFGSFGNPTLVGPPTPAVGIRPAPDGSYWAYHFKAASSSYIDYGSPGYGAPLAATFCAWIKLDSLPTAGNYYCVGLPRPTLLGYVKDTGQLALYTGPAGAQAYDPGILTVTTGRWYHLAFSYSNAAGGAGYVDGVLDSTTASGGDLGAITNFQIGNDATTRFFDGIIDDVRFYNRVLSKAEILSIRAEAFQPTQDIETIALEQALQAAGVVSPDDFSRRRRVVFRGPRRGPLTGRQYVEVPFLLTANAILTQDAATLSAGAQTTPFESRHRAIPSRWGPRQGPLRGRGYDQSQAQIGFATAFLTQADQTLSAAATVAIAATASLTQADQTLSAAATVAISATATLTQANQTLSAAAVLPISGTASLTQADQTLSAAATLIVGGTAALTQDDQSLSATATTVSGSINASAALVQDDFALLAAMSTGFVISPPPSAGHGHRRDLGPHWRYRPLKKRNDIKAELEELEEVCEQIAEDLPEEVQPDELVERSHRLIEAIEAATEKVKAETTKRAFRAMQERAIEVRRKLAEEEEEAAWLLLHLL